MFVHEYRPIPGFEMFSFATSEESDAFKELPWLSDRAAGIVAATLLENRVESLLSRHFVNNDAATLESLFGGNAPLETFGAQIRAAYAMGLLSEQGRKDLDFIRKIRNSFAHDLLSSTFQTRRIIDLCSHIKLVDQFVAELPEGLRGVNVSDADAFEEAIFRHHSEMAPIRSGGLRFFGTAAALADARSRFFLAINCYAEAILRTKSDRQPYL